MLSMRGIRNLEAIIARTIDTYDKIASEYANCWLDDPVMKDSLAKFIDYLPQDSLVIDVGCGIGRDTKYLIDRGINTIGVDISMGMLRVAKRLMPDGNFFLMDMRTLGFLDETFKGIWACASVVHLPKYFLSIVLGEFNRILKKDGILFLSMQEGDNEAFLEPEGRFFAYHKMDELNTILGQHGFQVFDFETKQTGKNTFNKPIMITWLNFWGRKV